MPEVAPRILVLGGARSGKSAFAQAQAEASGRSCVYVATAHAGDAEMAARIAAHVATRGSRWRTVEAPDDLTGALEREARGDAVVVVDCLTLWLSNRLLAKEDVTTDCEQLTARLAAGFAAPVLLVSNEVGGGIVPPSALGRRFRDLQGRLNQDVAAICDEVLLVSAGLPQRLKPTAPLVLSL